MSDLGDGACNSAHRGIDTGSLPSTPSRSPSKAVSSRLSPTEIRRIIYTTIRPPPPGSRLASCSMPGRIPFNVECTPLTEERIADG